MSHILSALASFNQLAQNSAEADAAAAGAVILFLLSWCCIMFLVLALMGFWIWMIIDCATKDFPGDNDKVVWILVIVLGNWVGALIYFFVGRPRGKKQ